MLCLLIDARHCDWQHHLRGPAGSSASFVWRGSAQHCGQGRQRSGYWEGIFNKSNKSVYECDHMDHFGWNKYQYQVSVIIIITMLMIILNILMRRIVILIIKTTITMHHEIFFIGHFPQYRLWQKSVKRGHQWSWPMKTTTRPRCLCWDVTKHLSKPWRIIRCVCVCCCLQGPVTVNGDESSAVKKDPFTV